MTASPTQQAIDDLRAAGLAENPAMQPVIHALEVQGDNISVGDMSHVTGVAIGRNARAVVNQFNLAPETVGAVVDALRLLGSRPAGSAVDSSRYALGTLIADKARGFVGREGVFEAIEAFLANNSSGYFVIEADPGMGKSALLAEYVRRTGCIAHFNVQSLGINTARHFLENVCSQIIVDFGLPYPTLPPDAADDGGFLMQLLTEASSRLDSGERLVIAVDAMDEVDWSGHPEGPNLLYLPPVVPNGVFFIMTKRDVELPLSFGSACEDFNLMEHPAENRADVERYLTHAAERPTLQGWIDGQGIAIEDFVARLTERSESNFMYLRYVLPEIERGAYHDLSAESLPSSLEGYYKDHWRRMGMTSKPLPHLKIRVVYILSEIKQPVSRALITQFASTDGLKATPLDVQQVLDEWAQFLHEELSPEGTRYSVYHASFRDFLHKREVVQAAGISLPEVHRLIADDLWNDLYGGT